MKLSLDLDHGSYFVPKHILGAWSLGSFLGVSVFISPLFKIKNVQSYKTLGGVQVECQLFKLMVRVAQIVNSLYSTTLPLFTYTP
jgi:hypothetical protein